MEDPGEPEAAVMSKRERKRRRKYHAEQEAKAARQKLQEQVDAASRQPAEDAPDISECCSSLGAEAESRRVAALSRAAVWY